MVADQNHARNEVGRDGGEGGEGEKTEESQWGGTKDGARPNLREGRE